MVDTQRQGIVTINTASLAEVPKTAKPPTQKKGYSPEEASRLLAVKDHPFETVNVLLLSLGLRRGEAFGLKCENVDLEKGEIRVLHNLQNDHDRQWTPMDVKTASSQKYVVSNVQLCLFTIVGVLC